MFLWNKWRNPIAMFAVAGMLIAAGIVFMMAAGDVSDAADGNVQIGALSQAAEDFELAWFQIMHADAVAATGNAEAEARGFYDGGLNLYNSSKAVLSAAGRTQIDQAIAASDQGLAAAGAAFEQTIALANTGDIEGATDNHLAANVGLYGQVDPAVKGLAQIAQAADAELKTKLDNGASQLRIMSSLSLAVAIAGAVFAGWTAWSVYRKEDEEQAVERPASMERAA